MLLGVKDWEINPSSPVESHTIWAGQWRRCRPQAHKILFTIILYARVVRWPAKESSPGRNHNVVLFCECFFALLFPNCSGASALPSLLQNSMIRTMISFQRHLTMNLNRLGTALLRLGPPYSLPTGPPTTPLCLFGHHAAHCDAHQSCSLTACRGCPIQFSVVVSFRHWFRYVKHTISLGGQCGN